MDGTHIDDDDDDDDDDDGDDDEFDRNSIFMIMLIIN